MYSIKKLYSNFYSECHFCHELIRVPSPTNTSLKIYIKDDQRLNPKAVFIQTTGVINRIWQSWNNYWRNYWLTHFYGGIGYQSTIAQNSLLLPNITTVRVPEEAAIYLILQAANRDMRKYRNGIVTHFQEPTWGDAKLIQALSLAFNASGAPGPRILPAMSAFGDPSNHLQLVRNASIHISKESQVHLKQTLMNRYIIPHYKYPTDFVYAKPIGQTKTAIHFWIDEILAFLQLI